MYLIDSEGLFDTDKGEEDDRKIITLVILLSSYLIFYSVGVIDGQSLEQLALTLELSKHLTLPPGTSISAVYPNLMWVLRDFQSQFPVDSNGVQINSKQYLENALAHKPGVNSTLNEKREKLRTTFLNRDCCTLVRPTFDDKGPGNTPLSQLRPEFQANLQSLKKSVFSNQKPVCMNSVQLSGEQYYKVAESFLAALNSNSGMLQYQSVWQLLSTSECEKAIQEAIRMYVAAMDKIRVPNENSAQMDV